MNLFGAGFLQEKGAEIISFRLTPPNKIIIQRMQWKRETLWNILALCHLWTLSAITTVHRDVENILTFWHHWNQWECSNFSEIACLLWPGCSMGCNRGLPLVTGELSPAKARAPARCCASTWPHWGWRTALPLFILENTVPKHNALKN